MRGRQAARRATKKKESDVVHVPPPPATAAWRKSSASASAGCVEVATTHDHVWVRDTKNRAGGTLGFTRKEWAAFLIGVEHGEFDCPVPPT